MVVAEMNKSLHTPDPNEASYCNIYKRKLLHNNIKCSSCKLRMHKRCAVFKKTKWKIINTKRNSHWICNNCITLFPFHNVNDNDFLFSCSSVDISSHLFMLHNECSNHNIDVLVMIIMIKINMISHWILIPIDISIIHCSLQILHSLMVVMICVVVCLCLILTVEACIATSPNYMII